ncbi:MAG: hypothetical protein AAF518_08685 [Spirochaetota bacterium]
MQQIILSILLGSVLWQCTSTPTIPDNASKKDPTIYVIMDPCSCSQSEWELVAQKKILWNSLGDYMLRNYIVLGDDIKGEILQEPKRFLYDFSLEKDGQKKKKQRPEGPKKDTTPPRSQIYIYDGTKNSWKKPHAKPLVSPPIDEEYSSPQEKGNYMNFDGYEEDWSNKQLPANLQNKAKAKAKLNHNEIKSFLQKKPSKKIQGKYKAYGDAQYRNRGLEVIQSFRSKRGEHRRKLREREKFRANSRKERFKKYQLR